ncbi:MAG: hypothetical protein ACK40O_10970, partial [Allosphingosinicella sp.]
FLEQARWEDAEDEALAASLLGRRTKLLERSRELAMESAGALRTRIHGDLHLGQVLVAGSDVVIIDFEGEPSKPLEERRAKDLPLRDVAGIIRSFDYSTAVARRTMPAVAETVHARAEHAFHEFCECAVTGFLDGYTEVSGRDPGPLLDLFLLEKAAYELRYEAASRPDWLSVPLAGFARIAERITGEGDE